MQIRRQPTKRREPLRERERAAVLPRRVMLRSGARDMPPATREWDRRDHGDRVHRDANATPDAGSE
jgi:hypothetical protein